MYKIVNFSDSNTYTVLSKTENVSNIVDKMIRLTAEITEVYASDIYYDIRALYKSINQKSNFDRLLFFRLDGVVAYEGHLTYPDIKTEISESIQIWRLTYDSKANTTTLQRVSVIEKK